MQTQFKHSTMVELANYAIEKITDFNYQCYGSELFDKIFNNDYYLIGHYAAEQWILQNFDSVFSAIDLIVDYEMNEYGQLYTDLKSAESVCNMLVYIAGHELLCTIQCFNNQYFDTRLNEESREAIINELNEMYNN